jgi:putative phosphoribosyl transferase
MATMGEGVGLVFADRDDAGRRLGARVREAVRREGWSEPLVLGLARGGVPVALRVAEALDAPLDVLVVRKISAPGRPEFGVGAVTADGPARYDESVLTRMGLTPADLRAAYEREKLEARRRLEVYRRGRRPTRVAGREVVLVDDGVARGVTARAALRTLRDAGARRLLLAIPVCARQSVGKLGDAADELVYLAAPAPFDGVGRWYRNFAETTDDEVLAALAARPD